MDREALAQRLMETFLGELEDNLRTLEAQLLALDEAQGADRAELFRSLFRIAHTLKGASRSVDVRPIEAVCHELEGILGALRDGQGSLTPQLGALLLEAADALKDAERRLREKATLDGTPIEAVLPRLHVAAVSAAPFEPAALRSPVAPRVEAPVVEDRTFPTTRVSTKKLDVLVTGAGELMLARQRPRTRSAELARIRETLHQCRQEWSKLEKPARQLLKRELAAAVASPAARRRSALQQSAGARRAALAIERTAAALVKLDRDLDALATRMEADQSALTRVGESLEEDIRRIRMVPFADACEGLQRTVRDVAQAASKDVQLEISGGEVELDRAIVDCLKDALLHLVRNAVDHGIEPPVQRAAAGKPARGNIRVSASLRGGRVEIVVRDDGRGIDVAAVRVQARRRGMTEPESDAAAAKLVLVPGFSTARLVTDISGRGVGLDVVAHRLASVNGHIDMTFERGVETRFTLTVPLTLGTIRALMVEAGGQPWAIPLTNVDFIVRAKHEDIGSVEGRDVLLSAGAPIPLIPLVDALGMKREVRERGGRIPIVVVGTGAKRVALAVDDLLAEQDVVVKNLGARLRRVRHLSGATILASGGLALILSTSELIDTALASRGRPLTKREARAEARKRLLVVDDSPTTRTLMKSILEGAGYEVAVAVDGEDAWQHLQHAGADLVVADVEMPRMDGFRLCETLRASRTLRTVPLVLVTALQTEADRTRGLLAGADAYLVKTAFDQRHLLQTIARLV